MEVIIGFAVFLGAVVIMSLVVFIKANLKICEPNEVMIFSGRRYKDKDGNVVGYRVIKGGRGFKLPLLESVNRLSLNTIPIEIDVVGALTRGAIPVNVKVMANVKIAGTAADGLANAIERFLGKTPLAISATAKEIIEGSMRGVLASLEPDEANADRLALARQAAAEAGDDMQRLGLILDTLKILELNDEKGYLEAIGRKRNAEVKRDARVVEAEADAQASRKESETKKLARIAEIEAQRSVIEVEQSLRAQQAAWSADANRQEEKAKLAGEIARMEEFKVLEAKRVDTNKLKYEAEVIVPAEAEKVALQKRAAGLAASTFEEGKAKAEALKLLHEQWEKHDSQNLFMIQLLPEIVEKVSKVIASNLSVERLTVVDAGGNGGGVPHLVGTLAGAVNSFMEQIKTLTGLDITKFMEDSYGRKADSVSMKGA